MRASARAAITKAGDRSSQRPRGRLQSEPLRARLERLVRLLTYPAVESCVGVSAFTDSKLARPRIRGGQK
jgi:hypothetical protein